MSDDLAEFNGLLRRAADGDRTAIADVIAALNGELQVLARAQRKRFGAGATLQTTALVNEAYLKLFGGRAAAAVDRDHFLALAAVAMRSVLVDQARSKGRQKREGTRERTPLDDIVVAYEEKVVDLIALHEALERLAAVDPRLAKQVELRFFAGADVTDCARMLGISERTAAREWRTARAWLRRELG